MKCINCGVATRRLRRHFACSLPVFLLKKLARWLTIEVPGDANICHPCFKNLNAAEVNDARKFGYTMVCIICGRSVRSVQTHVVERNDSMMQNLPISHPAFHQNPNYACHPCWLRHQRQTNQNKKRITLPRHENKQEFELDCHKCTESSPPLRKDRLRKRTEILGVSNRRSSSVSSFDYEDERSSTSYHMAVEASGTESDDAGSCVSSVYSENESEESSPNHQVLVFCPKCDEAVPHTVQGVQQDQTKILVAKVYHYFEQEYEQLKKLYGSIDLTPLSKFRQRTALATGVSESNVLRILKEEEERAARVKEVPQERGRKRARQASSDGENDSDDDDPGEPSNSTQNPEEGVETYVVKVEPPDYHPESEIYTDPLQQVKEEPKDSEYVEVEAAVASVMVKPEPPEDIPDTTKTTAVTKAVEPNVRKGRKKPRKSEVTSTQLTQGEPSTAQASGGVPAGELDERMLEDGTVVVEKFEIHEEGFS